MIFTYQLTFEEFRSAKNKARDVSGSDARFNYFVGTFIVLLGAQWWLVRGMPSPEPVHASLKDSAAAWAPWIVIFLIIWSIVFRILRGGLRNDWLRLRALHWPTRVEFRSEGFSVTDAGRNLNYGWPAVRDVVETRTVSVLRLLDGTFHVLPARVFSDSTTRVQWRRYIESNLRVVRSMSATTFSESRP